MTQTARLKWLLQRSPRLALSLCKDIPPPQALRWDWSIGKLRDCHEKPKIFKKPSRVCSVWNEVVFILQQLLRWPPEVPKGQLTIHPAALLHEGWWNKIYHLKIRPQPCVSRPRGGEEGTAAEAMLWTWRRCGAMDTANQGWQIVCTAHQVPTALSQVV